MTLRELLEAIKIDSPIRCFWRGGVTGSVYPVSLVKALNCPVVCCHSESGKIVIEVSYDC